MFHTIRPTSQAKILYLAYTRDIMNEILVQWTTRKDYLLNPYALNRKVHEAGYIAIPVSYKLWYKYYYY